MAPILLADACRIAGCADEGLAIIDRVWRDTRETGLRWFAAELQRLKGELLLLRGEDAAPAAAACFRGALEIARAQGNRFYELRAATSWARLGRGRRNHGDARGALERVYAEFTEGFETPDLRAAAALLKEGNPRRRKPARRRLAEELSRG